MSDIATFVVELNEKLSGGMQRAAASTHSSFEQIGMDVKKAQNGLDTLERERKINVDYSGLQAAHVEMKSMQSTWDTMRGTMLGGLAIGGAMYGASKAYEIGVSALEAGMDAEQQLIGLTTFIGKDKAKDLYAQLQKDSALTPFTTSQILPGMQQLIAQGVNVQEAHRDQWALMNALSATGNAGNGFALELGQMHLAQMASMGRVNARFMMEFQRTLHIPMEKLLSDYMHVPQKTIGNWTQDGKLAAHVTYEDFVGALDKASKAGGMFAGALEAQSQTIRGKESTIKDWWNIGWAKTVLNPKVHDSIIHIENSLISDMEKLPGILEQMIPTLEHLGDDIAHLIDWTSTHTGEIKRNTERLINLTEAIIAWKGLQMIGGIGKGFMSGLNGIEGATAAEGGLLGGLTGKSAIGWAGTAAGWASTTEIAGASIAAIGGMAALITATALVAWQQWKNYKADNVVEKAPADGWGPHVVGKYAVMPMDNPFVINTPAHHKTSMAAIKAMQNGYATGLLDMRNHWQHSDAAKHEKGAHDAAAGDVSKVGDSIVGGGPKQIRITAQFGEHMVVNVNEAKNGKEVAKQVMDGFKAEYYHMIKGIPGME